MKTKNGKLNTNCVKSWTGDIKLQQKCTIFLFDPLCLGGLGFYRTSYAQLMHVYRNFWAPALQYEQTDNHASTNLKLQLNWNWEIREYKVCEVHVHMYTPSVQYRRQKKRWSHSACEIFVSFNEFVKQQQTSNQYSINTEHFHCATYCGIY